MKAFLILILSISFTISVFGQSDSGIRHKIIVSARLKSTKRINDSCYILFASVTIQNISGDTLRYYYELCGSPFEFDNKEGIMEGIACDTDGIVTEVLPPHSNTTHNVKLYINKPLLQLQSKKIRIGLIYLHYTEIPFYPLRPSSTYVEKLKEARNNPIWSNTLEIK